MVPRRHFPSVVMQPVSMKPKVKREMSHGDLGELGCDGRYARETEQKRVKGQRSCAECTRLKIKCNKQIPCQSCRVSRFSIPWHSYHNNNFRSFTYFHSEGVAKHYVPMEASSQAKELGTTIVSRLVIKHLYCRSILAATEHLQRQLAKMRERVHQLEDALSELQARHSTEPHPLLQLDLFGKPEHESHVDPPKAHATLGTGRGEDM
ncbi:hypothetical protein EDD17DRAFT_236056 [Pisolithus thermaeus]|nr:hypothetical protein EDD17DRAFT_236056 [Pisolithus thermaeus]